MSEELDELRHLRFDIHACYKEYKSAVKEYRHVARSVVVKERDIEQKKAHLYDDGLINGKNAEAREAQARFHLNVDFEQLDTLKYLEAQAYDRKEQAEIDIEYVRAMLRVEELASTYRMME